ncbi:hypothetical protein ACQP08_31370 [Micromonospora zamorensis]|uniref:hypothetical protein n=1 Tax=Micromonospora TaxID=1873 RepID=UPI00379ECF37
MTTARFGERTTFAVEVGGPATPGLRTVDLWLANKRLTVSDNAAYLPSLSTYMQADAHRVRGGDIAPCPFPGYEPGEVFRLLHAKETKFREQFWFMRWTEITDNVSTYAYLDGDLVIVFEFWRKDHSFPEELGKAFSARLPPESFVGIVEEATRMLDADSTRNPS